MPFTVSHAVVALPFARALPGLAAAIAIGAMTPDLPLFLQGTPLGYAVTHSWAWIPLTALVAGALLLAWWMLVRPGIREFSPRWLAERLPETWDERFRVARPWVTAPALFLGLALGVATHLGWDAFTHAGQPAAELLGLEKLWGPLPAYSWLQYGSSVIGLAVLLLAGILWVRRRPARPVRRVLPGAVRVVWWVSFPMALVTAWVVGLAVFGPFGDGFGPQHLAFRMLLPTAALWVVPSIMLCAVIRIRRRKAV